MAVTKTHTIKSTLKAAIDYICDPDKTDGKLLMSSFGCAAETADIEFEWTRRHAIDKGTNLGRHLIQAFRPGEVSPEEAHEIGMRIIPKLSAKCGNMIPFGRIWIFWFPRIESRSSRNISKSNRLRCAEEI